MTSPFTDRLTDRWLSRQEVQAFLGGRSRSALYVDIALNRLPKPRKLGGRIYWLRSELEAAMLGETAE